MPISIVKKEPEKKESIHEIKNNYYGHLLWMLINGIHKIVYQQKNKQRHKTDVNGVKWYNRKELKYNILNLAKRCPKKKSKQLVLTQNPQAYPLYFSDNNNTI